MKRAFKSILAVLALSMLPATPALALPPISNPVSTVTQAVKPTPVEFSIGIQINRGRPYYNQYRGYRYQRPGYRYYDGYWFPRSAFIIDVPVRPRIVQRRVPVYVGDAHVNWCYARYRSYRAYDNSFQPNHGRRRVCVSPYY